VRTREDIPTAADERRLARRIEQGDAAARDEMVVRNLGLVHALAARYRGRGVAHDDLVQEGTLGLIRAVERFDHRREVRFSTYAVWWIRRSFLEALTDAHTIRIPAGARRRMVAMGRLRAAPRVTASLDEPVGGGLAALGDLIADEGARGVAEQVEEREMRRHVWSLLRLLPERHRQVLVRRHGLGGPAQSHEEIGAWLGVGAERSRQIERQALHRLRGLGDRVPRVA
jgi:RNA polymerase primary sigma factor